MRSEGFLHGVRVLEIADEKAEYCGKVLAGLGADVVKIEPQEGEVTRSYGPFFEDRREPDRSLHFWHYNFGKRGITLDLDTVEGQGGFRRLAMDADVVLESRPKGYLDTRGLGYDALSELNPRLVMARLSPFGDTGPWADYEGSDVVHLALGGVVTNCGYEPLPDGTYETPPIAPQMWQAYHLAGEMMTIAIVSALYHQQATGEGQFLSAAVHQAVSQSTEQDIPNWVFSRLRHYRSTCRHSSPKQESVPIAAMTKDGRWTVPYRSYARTGDHEFQNIVGLLKEDGMAEDLEDPRFADPAYRAKVDVDRHIADVVARWLGRFTFDDEVWRRGQQYGLTWAPIRKPEENLTDEHWAARQTFFNVEHPELGRTFKEIGAKWVCQEVPWRTGPRAPLLGEHNAEILEFALTAGDAEDSPAPRAAASSAPAGRRRKRALAGVRVIDLGWMLASGGAGRFLSAQGAEVIKVEHVTRLDPMRWHTGLVPVGGRSERERMSGPVTRHQLVSPRPESPNRSGNFMDMHAGKRAISLNLKHPRGRELVARLVADANAVTEGFSPGTMDRMGLGYSRLREINPRIVYVQQSGMGQMGTYGRMRSFGPTAQAMSGITEMSGLPEPWPPAGIGYSYLDWFGAYNMATAVTAALYRQQATGKGCWIDSSQTEVGIYLTGTAVLDHSANGRTWRRYGNRSPHKEAAPHGIYPARGDDRWLAIACFTEDHWAALVGVLGSPEWAASPKYATRNARLARADELDALLATATSTWDPYELMDALQAGGVPAGVCQRAEDKVDVDPQLDHLGWLVELEQTDIGRWPAREFPVKFSATPPYMGGPIDRHGPNYGEDNEYVFGELLGLTTAEIRDLADDGVI